MFSLQKMKLKWEFITLHLPGRMFEPGGAQPFLPRSKPQGQKLHQGTFRLDIKENYSLEGWSDIGTCCRQGVESTSLEGFKNCVDVVPGDLFYWWTCQGWVSVVLNVLTCLFQPKWFSLSVYITQKHKIVMHRVKLKVLTFIKLMK